jgi:hypothetical protein
LSGKVGLAKGLDTKACFKPNVKAEGWNKRTEESESERVKEGVFKKKAKKGKRADMNDKSGKKTTKKGPEIGGFAGANRVLGSRVRRRVLKG